MAAENHIKRAARRRPRLAGKVAAWPFSRPSVLMQREIEEALQTIQQNVEAMRRDQAEIDRLQQETRKMLKQLGVR